MNCMQTCAVAVSELPTAYVCTQHAVSCTLCVDWDCFTVCMQTCVVVLLLHTGFPGEGGPGWGRMPAPFGLLSSEVFLRSFVGEAGTEPGRFLGLTALLFCIIASFCCCCSGVASFHGFVSSSLPDLVDCCEVNWPQEVVKQRSSWNLDV